MVNFPSLLNCKAFSSPLFSAYTDIFDTHDYEQNPEVYRPRYEVFMTEGKLYDQWEGKNERNYDGKKPVFISEYGGIGWSIATGGWGYGNAPKTEEEFKARFKGLTDVLMDNSRMFGLCYTQLYDIEQEQNGLYSYDRTPKFEDMDYFRRVFARKAAIED